MTKKQWIIIGSLGAVVVVIFVCMGCLILAMLAPQPSRDTFSAVASVTPRQLPTPLSVKQLEPTTLPQPTAQSIATAPVQSTPTSKSGGALTFEEITSAAKQLTEIKRNDYYKSLIGKSMHGIGKVADVTDSGEIRVRISSPLSYDVGLQGVAKNTYTGLNLNDAIEFDGTISKVEDLFGSGLPTLTVKSTSVKTQANATNPTPIKSGQSLTFEDIEKTAHQLTEIKRNDYYKSLIGKSIHQTGKVADVSNSGEVHVRITTTISYDIALQGVPKATYTALNLNDVIEFDGTITKVDDLFGSGSPTITVKSTSVRTK